MWYEARPSPRLRLHDARRTHPIVAAPLARIRRGCGGRTGVRAPCSRRRRRPLCAGRGVGPAARTQHRAVDAAHRGRTCRRPLRCAGSSRATKASPTSPLAAPRLRAADDAHSVHAEPSGLEPGRAYWYRFEALGQRSASGRTRTAPAADAAAGLRFALASCQRFDHGHYAAWRHVAGSDLDLVLFVGDYIYEYPSPPLRACASTKAARCEPSSSTARATRSTRAIRRCRRRMPRRRGCWCGTTTRSTTTTPACKARACRPTFASSAPRRTAPIGSTCRFRRRCGPAVPTCASTAAPTGDRWSASTRSTIASTATRRHARSPAAAAPTPCACATAPSCSTRSARCSVPRRSAGWPTAGTRDAAGTCSRSRP